jgi:predicted nucleic acid-binding protein
VLAWDTTLVSRHYPDGPLERRVVEAAQAGEPVAITAPTVMEVVRGLQGSAARDPRIALALPWFIRVLTSDLLELLPLDRAAAILAGRLRALHPTPPTGVRRKGVRPEQRSAWVPDIQIAACSWTHGRDLATENVRDFETLSDLIAALYPDTSPLVVTEL